MSRPLSVAQRRWNLRNVGRPYAVYHGTRPAYVRQPKQRRTWRKGVKRVPVIPKAWEDLLAVLLLSAVILIWLYV